MANVSRQILVTGGNSGIGLEMVKAFVADGHEVAIAARDLAKTMAAIDSLREQQPNAKLHAIALDLADFTQVDAAALTVLSTLPALDTVMLNAGSFTNGLRQLDNGLESMIGTMHFGHFRLMQHLLPSLHKAALARVVVTSSVAHWAGHLDAERYENPSRYWSDFAAYGSAKLANLVYARALAAELQGSAIRVNAFHPGGVATGIWRELPGPVQWLVDKVLISPTQGADTAVWLALADDAAHHHGQYFVRRKKAMTSSESKDPAVAATLMAASAAIAGI
ncbi:NAD(P)-dependent dehydrogenase (short-subunit alcohol dehydrogenase family) [Paraperlucidibaca baekdonensis]|uniref:NAD(P)-dependent dehydrogenase (Short-subunit alcohol dehydrogenase family) n=1 Tax=Paraperlucidibaca baekdonensis TaxID=748120 RepID=A0A3E0H0Z9_9GAMM|nr:SDR family NAD(P)-dependent oxidoreductase [Paraperlucidibaca baekdonensis]REH36704.1 NAD(P)-dependent dehydrogenase (short-subunit alcohol dehydrogenase family) [Paraperlucidibaca baekdonensis]